MNCSRMHLLISEYFDDELSEVQKQAVEEHILLCSECYEEFIEMRELTLLLKQALAPYRVSEAGVNAFAGRIARQA